MYDYNIKTLYCNTCSQEKRLKQMYIPCLKRYTDTEAKKYYFTLIYGCKSWEINKYSFSCTTKGVKKLLHRALLHYPPSWEKLKPWLFSPKVPFFSTLAQSKKREKKNPVTIPSLLGEYLALLSQQYGIWVILLNMNGPFTGLNGVAWQWPSFPSLPPYSKQYSAQQSWHFSPKSTKEELEAVPETLKELSLCEMQVLGTSRAI